MSLDRKQFFAAVGLLVGGYMLGRSHLLEVPQLQAQDAAQQETPKLITDELSEEAVKQVQTAVESLRAAVAALRQDGRYNAATQGINTFAVTTGGLDAVEDLESGRGVDPETFAGLYAGLATDEVSARLGRDEQGRLTYRNKVIRLYSVARLKKAFDDRNTLSGETATTQQPLF